MGTIRFRTYITPFCVVHKHVGGVPGLNIMAVYGSGAVVYLLYASMYD